ncbi:histidinol dehydrogenase [Prolixibacter sp. SD074]|jgi:histidinol dehydrogenase|uniref:histidinol dehydrogenase n=1 Tax=Prolixibacter sp. SD074 TaxID=2652391 RepID=UPI0012707CC2|nr:histidinol dehydrogenase [Prolixibacter sp. SD074]GET31046.1 histidinol dehydrogenase [Prolixibacter sp. SD074]
MQIHNYPLFNTWPKILSRPANNYSSINSTVRMILDNVKKKGDAAVRDYTRRFDGADLEEFRVSKDELEKAAQMIEPKLKEAIQKAAKNILAFHEIQKPPMRMVETTPGVKCWQKSVPIDKVGLYIPGGSAPLFSTVLMLGIPAQIAGCKEIILCTPPNEKGEIHPAILFAAGLVEVSRIYKIGGVQAIGAMAYGTETVPRVYKIFGPGNSWVTAAKQAVSVNDCAIDMPAGPSELAIMADESANPEFIAADLLSQAEHGPDSQVILVTTEEPLITKVLQAIDRQMSELPRAAIATKALENSRAILVNDEEQMVELINFYAPEHLIIATRNTTNHADRITNAGSVFLGNFTPESAGDYASGTNHTLPTQGWARSFSGLNLESFCKKITFQEISRDGIQQLGPIIEAMAEGELLFAHKNAATLRINSSDES